MKTRVTELLGITYPVLQGGMAWVSDAQLAAAVSNGGGLGIIACAAAPADVIEKEIWQVKKLTDKPYGINIMMMSPYVDDMAELVKQEDVPVVTTGAGNPSKYIAGWKEIGTKVLPVIPSVALAKRMEQAGADGVIAEGCESGGHIGELTTMALVPQVVSNVSIPVIAAGGIADGRGVAAALMLGAEGVQCGTVFLAAEECTIHQTYKDLVLKATDISTVVTGRSHGHPARCLKSPMVNEYVKLEKAGVDFMELEKLSLGSLRKAVKEGNREEGSFMCGQIAGLVKEIRPAAVIVKDLIDSGVATIRSIEEKTRLWGE